MNKIILLSCADVVAIVAWKKWRRHVAAYENATCHTRVHVRMCKFVCVRVCARVRACVCV